MSHPLRALNTRRTLQGWQLQQPPCSDQQLHVPDKTSLSLGEHQSPVVQKWREKNCNGTQHLSGTGKLLLTSYHPRNTVCVGSPIHQAPQKPSLHQGVKENITPWLQVNYSTQKSVYHCDKIIPLIQSWARYNSFRNQSTAKLPCCHITGNLYS